MWAFKFGFIFSVTLSDLREAGPSFPGERARTGEAISESKAAAARTIFIGSSPHFQTGVLHRRRQETLVRYERSPLKQNLVAITPVANGDDDLGEQAPGNHCGPRGAPIINNELIDAEPTRQDHCAAVTLTV